jgi:hypothetical protein
MTDSLHQLLRTGSGSEPPSERSRGSCDFQEFWLPAVASIDDLENLP